VKAPVGRGGFKLQAAVERFGLTSKIRGARAIDVGASTGGFTEVLLGCGAACVTAVDVGRGQLHRRLRADRRVELLEGTDFKTLSLHTAPGPFDFFTVDVSFVAARSMLRGLAFRLRDGATGVVLVKSQFELPGHAVRGGDARDPALRDRALAAFAKKAGALGFRVLAQVDPPVAGGSGTVEILAHLRYEGRTRKLPARPEKRGPADGRTGSAGAERGEPMEAEGEGARARGSSVRGSDPALKTQLTQRPRALSRRVHQWFAVAAPGLEAVVRAESERLPGVMDVRQVPGGVEFAGDIAVGMAANLHLRVATRVLLRLGEVRAREFSKLRRLLAKLPWEAFVSPERPLRFSATAHRCRLYHTGAVTETAALAIADGLGAAPPAASHAGKDGADGPADGGAIETRVLLRGQEDTWAISLDASGALLHRRGWRLEAGSAPLRETLAAGILALCGYDPTRPLVDPMCGAGTFALEAACIAVDRAPGLERPFAFESWPCFDAAAWARLRNQAREHQHPVVPAPILAFDRDARAVECARRNAERAGLAAHVTIERAAFGTRAAPTPPGLVVMNPPYGRRLGNQASGTRLAREVARVLRAGFPGWRAALLVADLKPSEGSIPPTMKPAGQSPSGFYATDQGLTRSLGLPITATHALSNGGLRVHLVVVDVPATTRA
jgi:putative N6-adenine-specific DNA methylase